MTESTQTAQKKTSLQKLTYAGLFLALAMILPSLTGHIPNIGRAIAPMHIPVLICGFVCGAPYGAVVGFLAPLLNSIFFGMPPMYPVAVSMAFELAAYGLLTGLFYHKCKLNLYLSLILSMAGGRLVWGAARFLMAGLAHTEFSFQMFLSGALLTAVPGIICHLIVVPLVVVALKRAKLLPDA